jgi:hypothetical protein
MGDYFAGEEVKFFLCLAWGVALRASHFLLLRQKKVSKEKATPGSVSGCAGFPALLETPGGWLNSPAAQTTPADCPRRSYVAQHLSRGPVKHPGPSSGFHFLAFFRVDRNSLFFCSPVVPHRLSGPHVARRATQALAEKGRGLFEGRSPEFRSPRQYRVAQGTRRSRAQNLGSPFLWLLSFGEAKESTSARKAEPHANEVARQAFPQKAHDA